MWCPLVRDGGLDVLEVHLIFVGVLSKLGDMYGLIP